MGILDQKGINQIPHPRVHTELFSRRPTLKKKGPGETKVFGLSDVYRLRNCYADDIFSGPLFYILDSMLDILVSFPALHSFVEMAKCS